MTPPAPSIIISFDLGNFKSFNEISIFSSLAASCGDIGALSLKLSE